MAVATSTSPRVISPSRIRRRASSLDANRPDVSALEPSRLAPLDGGEKVAAVTLHHRQHRFPPLYRRAASLERRQARSRTSGLASLRDSASGPQHVAGGRTPSSRAAGRLPPESNIVTRLESSQGLRFNTAE